MSPNGERGRKIDVYTHTMGKGDVGVYSLAIIHIF